ncbi:MAG: capsule biosynthesis protein, partial [Prevotella sp.]|nr:capsule biosynthesis protein [Prevotella sp.]
MRRYIILLFVMLLIPVCISAQSSMTDDQVFKFIIKEHEAGTSQQQIIIQLMQRGVDINQIRRVRKKSERMAKQEGRGGVSDDTEKTDGRSRDNAHKKKSPY